jgi:nucleoside-diphosphate-sugar epimerase
MKSEFERLSPQVVLDMFPYTEADAIALMNVFKGIAERVVAISSMDVYRAYAVFLQIESIPVELVPLTEDSALRQQLHLFRKIAERPLNAPADYEKILVERVVMNYPDLPGTIVRLPMVYGAQDPLNRLFPYLKRMDENRPAIVLAESLAQWRGSYGYVKNVAYAIALAVTNERAKGRIYHVADAEVLTEAERLSRVGKVARWQGKIVTLAREYLPTDWNLPYNTAQHWFVDTTRIRQELGYKEIVSPEEALKRTIDWQRSHPPKEISQWTGKELLDYATEDRILKVI